MKIFNSTTDTSKQAQDIGKIITDKTKEATSTIPSLAQSGYEYNEGSLLGTTEIENEEFEIQGNRLVKYNGSSENIELPKNIEIIGAEAFENSKNIKKINIPSTVKTIETSAFANSTLVEININNGLVEIKDYAYKGCTELESFVVPKSVKKIGKFVFDGCTHLISLHYEGKFDEFRYNIDKDEF